MKPNTIIPLCCLCINMLFPAVASAWGDGGTVKIGGDFNVKAKTGPIVAIGIGENPDSSDINIAGIQTQENGIQIGSGFRSNITTGPVASINFAYSGYRFGTNSVNLGGIQVRN
jgi:hypothetical protein